MHAIYNGGLEIDDERWGDYTYLNPEKMNTRKSQKFANQIHLALYGETFDDRLKKEKIFIVQNLLNMKVMDIKQIAKAINESTEFVKKVKRNLDSK